MHSTTCKDRFKIAMYSCLLKIFVASALIEPASHKCTQTEVFWCQELKFGESFFVFISWLMTKSIFYHQSFMLTTPVQIVVVAKTLDLKSNQKGVFCIFEARLSLSRNRTIISQILMCRPIYFKKIIRVLMLLRWHKTPLKLLLLAVLWCWLCTDLLIISEKFWKSSQ